MSDLNAAVNVAIDIMENMYFARMNNVIPVEAYKDPFVRHVVMSVMVEWICRTEASFRRVSEFELLRAILIIKRKNFGGVIKDIMLY